MNGVRDGVHDRVYVLLMRIGLLLVLHLNLDEVTVAVPMLHDFS